MLTLLDVPIDRILQLVECLRVIHVFGDVLFLVSQQRQGKARAARPRSSFCRKALLALADSAADSTFMVRSIQTLFHFHARSSEHALGIDRGAIAPGLEANNCCPFQRQCHRNGGRNAGIRSETHSWRIMSS